MSLSSSSFADFGRKISRHPERYFASVSLLFGIIFIILVPPFQIPDEFTHFTRSYEVSELKTAHIQHKKGVDHIGTMMPASILQTSKETFLRQKPGYPDVPQAKKYSLSQTKQALRIPLNKSATIFYDTGASPSYFPLLYMPQAIVIEALKLVSTPVVVMLYATRFVGLLIWITLATAALKILQPAQRKIALAGVLLLPMFISQASASTDPLINGLAVLFMALVATDYLRNIEPTNKKTLMLVLILAVMTLSKPVYALFGLLFLLLPNRKTGLLTWSRIALVILTPLILFVTWSHFTKRTDGPYYIESIAVSHANPSSQIAYLIPDVSHFIEPVANTLFLAWGDNVSISLIGEFGKLDTPLPLIFVILGYGVILLAVCGGLNKREEDALARKYYLNKKTIVCVTLTVVGYIGGVYLAMYVNSTPPHEKIITGVQGRYFLPLLPVFVLFATKNWATVQKKFYTVALTTMPVVVTTAGALSVYLRYYIVYPK